MVERLFCRLSILTLTILTFIHHDLAIALDLYPTVHAARIRLNFAAREPLENSL